MKPGSAWAWRVSRHDFSGIGVISLLQREQNPEQGPHVSWTGRASNRGTYGREMVGCFIYLSISTYIYNIYNIYIYLYLYIYISIYLDCVCVCVEMCCCLCLCVVVGVIDGGREAVSWTETITFFVGKTPWSWPSSCRFHMHPLQSKQAIARRTSIDAPGTRPTVGWGRRIMSWCGPPQKRYRL